MESGSIDEAAASVWGTNGYSGLLSVFSDVNIRAEQGVMQFAYCDSEMSYGLVYSEYCAVIQVFFLFLPLGACRA